MFNIRTPVSVRGAIQTKCRLFLATAAVWTWSRRRFTLTWEESEKPNSPCPRRLTPSPPQGCEEVDRNLSLNPPTNISFMHFVINSQEETCMQCVCMIVEHTWHRVHVVHLEQQREIKTRNIETMAGAGCWFVLFISVTKKYKCWCPGLDSSEAV